MDKSKSNKTVSRSLFLAAVALIGLVILYLVLNVVQDRYAMKRQINNSQIKLEMAAQRLDENAADAEADWLTYDEFLTAKVDTVAYIMDSVENGEAQLEQIATQWGLCTVYLTDEEGNVSIAVNGTARTMEEADLSRLIDYAHGEDDHAYKTVDDVCYYLTVRPDGSYLIGGVESSEMIAKQDERFTAAYSLNNMKVGTNGYIIAVNTADNTIAYTKDEDLIGQDASALGINAALKSGTSGWVTMKGEKWFYTNAEYANEDNPLLLIAVVSKSEITAPANVVVWCVMAVSFLALLVLLLYTIFLDLDEENGQTRGVLKFKRLSKKHFLDLNKGAKLRTVVVVAFVALLVGTAFVDSLSAVSRQRVIFDNKLSDVDTILDNNDARTEELTAAYNDEYTRRAENIAWTLNFAPELVNYENLAMLSKKANLKSVEVFDENGTVIAADRENMTFTLSTDEESQSYAFWQVVNGYVDMMVQEPTENDATGELIQYIGVSRGSEKGMVQIGVSPSQLETRLSTTDMAHVLHNIAVENGGFLFAVDAETGEFISYPTEKYVGRPAADYGMTEASLKDDYVGWQRIDGVKCFVMSRQHDNTLIYTAVPSSASIGNLISVTIICGIAGLIILLIMLFIAMICRPYETYEAAKDLENATDKNYFEIQLADGTYKKTRAADSRFEGRSLKFHELDASGKMGVVISTALGIAAIIILICIAAGVTEKNDMLTFILSRRWEPKINLFSVTYVVYVAVVVLAITAVIQRLLSYVCGLGSTRIVTFGRMINSFLRYAAFIGIVFYGLQFFGLDSKTLLTGVGILTLIVGLGAQQLVADIMAGLFIVFEGEFRVGDIVQIDGWRGTVEEIGIRTTKVLSGDRDVKIFRNSAISGVVNMTRQYSIAYADFSITSNESLEAVEKMFKKELPRIREALPEIVEGPFYDGVLEINADTFALRVSAVCYEADRGKLQMDLNRELKLILDEQDAFHFVASRRLS